MKTCYLFVLGALLMLSSSLARAEEIEAANIARAIGDGQWEWTVYIKGSAELLDNVDCVEYTLDPTFKESIQKICQKASDATPFPYSAKGYGTFVIKIKVTTKDNHTLSLSHQLVFDRPGPEEGQIALTNVAERQGEKLWKWSAYINAGADILGKISCVQYTLHPTFPNPIQEVCSVGNSGQPFGITAIGWAPFTLKATVFYKDGTVSRLERVLDFSKAP